MLYRTLFVILFVSGFATFGFAIAVLFSTDFIFAFGFAFSSFVASVKQLATMERIAYY